ncbi:UNVERIFIED_CONTAM: hypothetical protein K2H54_074821 [Gekko kuhli]
MKHCLFRNFCIKNFFLMSRPGFPILYNKVQRIKLKILNCSTVPFEAAPLVFLHDCTGSIYLCFHFPFTAEATLSHLPKGLPNTLWNVSLKDSSQSHAQF